MENKKDIIDINEPTNFDKIPRCFECNLISSLKLYYKEGKPMINYFSENKY